jgi:hypothetical protein
MVVLMIVGGLAAWCLVRSPGRQPAESGTGPRPDDQNGSVAKQEPTEPPAARPEPPAWVPSLARRGTLDLQVNVEGGTPDAVGTRALLEGQKVVFQIHLDQDAYVGIWTIDPDETITQVFPNEFEPNHLLQGGTSQTVPGKDSYRIKATLSRGTEWVWVVASTEPWNEFKGRQHGPFLVFENAEERQDAKRQLRGLALELAAKPDRVLVAQKLFPYRVSPDPGPK